MSVERHAVEPASRWWGEHLHRYNEAVLFINRDDIILDIACGTGFGTHILANHSKGLVVGGDISHEAVVECNKHWKKENLQFKVLDGTKLDFPEAYFDKIVSFETIEHTTQYQSMIGEFARVLKPGGKLILSTPNIKVSSPDGVIVNPFHTQEFTYDELKSILAKSFPDIQIWGQRYKRFDKNSTGTRTGKFFERLFLSFGIRKLPYSWRSGFMKTFFGHTLYAKETDYTLEKDHSRIEKECPVLFAICRK